MSAFTGTGRLLRVALRRDRLLLAAWLAGFVVMAATSARGTVDLYPTLASRIAAADNLNRTQAIVALYGRVYDPTSVGAIAMIKMGGLGSVFVAMMAIVVVVRHTRADEEAGRTELVGATAVGHQASLAAALGTAAVASAALALLTTLTLVACGLAVDGSIAFGLSWAGVGLAFAAVAATAAQLTPSARTATALSTAFLAAVYVLRAVGDAASEGGPRWLSWLSPIGWAQQFRPYAGNRWWVLLVTVAFAVAVTAGALALADRRDLGTGLLPTRAGPATAHPSLRTPLALTWRLGRVSFLGWAVAFVAFGILMGGLASTVGDFLDSPQAKDFITKLGGVEGLTDAYVSLVLGVAGIVASAYAIQVVVRLRAEETGLRAEPLLATAAGRLRWAGGYVLVAGGGAAALLVLIGVAAGIARGLAAGDATEAGRVLLAALVQVPAALVLMAVAVALLGLAPRSLPAAWAVLAGFVLLGEIGPLLDLDQWVMDLSPFGHTPRLPGGTFSATPLVALTALAALLTAAGLAGLRRRDIG